MGKACHSFFILRPSFFIKLMNDEKMAVFFMLFVLCLGILKNVGFWGTFL